MNKIRTLGWRSVIVALPMLMLVGCTGNAVKPQLPSYDHLMQQATASKKAHEPKSARHLYHQAAEADPTRGDPWLQLARMAFNQQEYGRVIVAARETLKRDPANVEAQSLLTVSGLRVAVQALGVLRNKANADHAKGLARREATRLVSTMRDVLGEDVLVPPSSDDDGDSDYQPPIRHESSGSSQPSGGTPAVTETPDQPNTDGDTSKSTSTCNNPFSALPGGGC